MLPSRGPVIGGTNGRGTTGLATGLGTEIAGLLTTGAVETCGTAGDLGIWT